MHFGELHWPEPDDFRSFDAATFAAIRESLDRLLAESSDPSPDVLSALRAAVADPASSDERVVMRAADLFAQFDPMHVGDVAAHYDELLAWPDDDPDEDDRDADPWGAPGGSELIDQIGAVPAGRYGDLMQLAVALVAPTLGDPVPLAANVAAVTERWDREAEAQAESTEAYSDAKQRALSGPVGELRSALDESTVPVDAVERALAVVGGLRWEYHGADMRLAHGDDSDQDESDWAWSAIRYKLLRSLEQALGMEVS